MDYLKRPKQRKLQTTLQKPEKIDLPIKQFHIFAETTECQLKVVRFTPVNREILITKHCITVNKPVSLLAWVLTILESFCVADNCHQDKYCVGKCVCDSCPCILILGGGITK